jgi:hypothetical protein
VIVAQTARAFVCCPHEVSPKTLFHSKDCESDRLKMDRLEIGEKKYERIASGLFALATPSFQ